MKLVCIDCGKELSKGEFDYHCTCGGLFDIVHDFREYDADLLKQLFHKRLSERMTPYASGVWRYKELIFPELPDEDIVTKYEGNTGLYSSASIQKYTGVRQVWVKAQSENPSGSFKDNGMTVAVSHGKSLRYKKFTCTSTGNTSSSLAMYASIANADSYVFVPDKDISINKVLQTLAYGAKVFSFGGTYDHGIQFLEKYSSDLGLYVCNSINPFRIEGQKSIIYEAAQYLNWELPDWIIVPGGALSNATALGKGLQDLFTLGFIDKMPRVAIVQAEGASPFHKLVAEEKEELIPEPFPYTRASALNIGHPPSWKKALQTLKGTNGITISVPDEEILDAKAVIDRSGIGCEPASAATIAGLRSLVSQQLIDKEESVLCILTGNMLKDTDVLNEYHFGDSINAAFKNTLQNAGLTLNTIRKFIIDR
ncbi:threonine synthase [Metabacillus arenae]|uniref:Threonine synthase n=1 Tax=Metabacillus arenae TaxID=2771434 RepID=A0A926RZ76_9BACI|nr:threonine synthase [Metabacillus arenae]MBD1382816.1 threonine synthase [Metabacillus arenae]